MESCKLARPRSSSAARCDTPKKSQISAITEDRVDNGPMRNPTVDCHTYTMPASACRVAVRSVCIGSRCNFAPGIVTPSVLSILNTVNFFGAGLFQMPEARPYRLCPFRRAEASQDPRLGCPPNAFHSISKRLERLSATYQFRKLVL
jgi:hypothetical protein